MVTAIATTHACTKLPTRTQRLQQRRFSRANFTCVYMASRGTVRDRGVFISDEVATARSTMRQHGVEFRLKTLAAKRRQHLDEG